MNLTKQEIKTLKGKCPECKGDGKVLEDCLIEGIEVLKKVKCDLCSGTGQGTTEIDKECMCGHIYLKHNEIQIIGGNGCSVVHREGDDDVYCECDEFISKYKVGDEIEELDSILNEEEHGKSMVRIIKLKIISETEDKYKVVSNSNR